LVPAFLPIHKKACISTIFLKLKRHTTKLPADRLGGEKFAEKFIEIILKKRRLNQTNRSSFAL